MANPQYPAWALFAYAAGMLSMLTAIVIVYKKYIKADPATFAAASASGSAASGAAASGSRASAHTSSSAPAAPTAAATRAAAIRAERRLASERAAAERPSAQRQRAVESARDQSQAARKKAEADADAAAVSLAAEQSRAEQEQYDQWKDAFAVSGAGSAAVWGLNNNSNGKGTTSSKRIAKQRMLRYFRRTNVIKANSNTTNCRATAGTSGFNATNNHGGHGNDNNAAADGNDDDNDEFDEVAWAEAEDAAFVATLRRARVADLGELAAAYSAALGLAVTVVDVVAWARRLERRGALWGVNDDRGRYVHLGREGAEAVARWVAAAGRVTLAELAVAIGDAVELAPRPVVVVMPVMPAMPVTSEKTNASPEGEVPGMVGKSDVDGAAASALGHESSATTMGEAGAGAGTETVTEIEAEAAEELRRVLATAEAQAEAASKAEGNSEE